MIIVSNNLPTAGLKTPDLPTPPTAIYSKGGVYGYYISIYLSPARVKNRDFAMFLWQFLAFLRENVREI